MLLWLVVILGVSNVACFDENLRRHSVVYGISTLARGNDTECAWQLREFLDGVDKKHLWALKALDASGRPESGFLLGNNLWIGSHSQCGDISNTKPLEINYDVIPRAEATPHDFPPFEMHFVMAHLKHNSTLQQHTQLPLETIIQLGLCVPQSCNSADLKQLVQEYFASRYLDFQNFYSLDLNVIKLRILKEDIAWMFSKTVAITTIIVVGVIIALTAIGTILDINQKRRIRNMVVATNGKQDRSKVEENASSNQGVAIEERQQKLVVKILKCFSLRTNIQLLVNTKTSSDSVPAIHGLRLFGMLWVMMVHSVFYQSDFFKNPPYGFRLSETFFNQILSNSTYCVDTYLFLSGFLLSYMFYKSKTTQLGADKRPIYLKKISEFFIMFFNRYIRLTPTYMIVVCVASVVYSYYRETSALYSSEQLEDNCAIYWWRNILYINNLFPRSEMCMSWSWYLSLDTQCFTVSSFLLILSTIWFKTAATLLFVLMSICIGLTAYKSYSIGYIPTMDEQLSKLDAIYDLPWNRMGPYLVGVIAGYILRVKLNRKLELRKATLVLLWTVFPLLNLWILFTIYTRKISVEFSAFYMATSRTLWGVGLAWLLIACCTNNAGLINDFLSFKGWIPFSRLTYCCYLLNPLLSTSFYLGSETTFHCNSQSIAMSAYAIGFVCFFYSFWTSLVFETPFILLTKVVVSKLISRKVVPSKNPV